MKKHFDFQKMLRLYFQKIFFFNLLISSKHQVKYLHQVFTGL